MHPARPLTTLALALGAGLAMQTPLAWAQPASSSPSLQGLWAAKRDFGPRAAGAVIVTRRGAGFEADLEGRRVPLEVQGRRVSFALPDGAGTFKGRWEAGGLTGVWVQPPLAATAQAYASPLRLSPTRAGVWRGVVAPLTDRFDFYLKLDPQPDGTTAAFLRNPQRDLGAQWGVTRLVRTGDTLRLMGRRNASQPEREVATGRVEPEGAGFTLAFPGRGGTYDFRPAADQSGFYPRGRSPAAYRYAPPPAENDGWPVASVEEVGLDRSGVEQLVSAALAVPMQDTSSEQLEALLVARHGKLVLEEYFHDQTRDALHETRSAAKSLTATLVGAAIQAGAPLRLRTSVYAAMNGGRMPEGLEPRKQALALEDLLTNASGFYCDDTDPNAPGNEERITDDETVRDYYRVTLDLPMIAAPGERSVYCSMNPNLAMGVVGAVTHEDPVELFDRLLARPMQIDRYAYSLDPLGRPYGGGSAQLRPRDFLKFGQLMLDGGVWKGRRLLGADFVKRASSPLYHLRGIGYGYLWWTIDLPYRDRQVRAYFAGGAGGQGVVVIPELDMVVGVFAGNYSDGRTAIRLQHAIAPRWVLPAVREPGERNFVYRPRDFITPYGRNPDGSRMPGTGPSLR